MRIAADIQFLHRILDHVRSHALAAGLSPLEAKRLELACEEIIVNVILYAYAGRKGEIEISVSTPSPGEVQVEVSDNGPPFDPLAARPHPDTDLPLEAREAGGLGLFLVRQIVDVLDYRRVGDCNTVTLIKRSEP